MNSAKHPGTNFSDETLYDEGLDEQLRIKKNDGGVFCVLRLMSEHYQKKSQVFNKTKRRFNSFQITS